MIQPVSSLFADIYYPYRNLYPYRREPPQGDVRPEKSPVAVDIVDLSAEAKAMLKAQNNEAI